MKSKKRTVKNERDLCWFWQWHKPQSTSSLLFYGFTCVSYRGVFYKLLCEGAEKLMKRELSQSYSYGHSPVDVPAMCAPSTDTATRDRTQRRQISIHSRIFSRGRPGIPSSIVHRPKHLACLSSDEKTSRANKTGYTHARLITQGSGLRFLSFVQYCSP